MELFKGTISNVKKEVLTETSGEIKETKIETRHSLMFGKKVVGSGGGGKIQTTHRHYTDFNIEKMAFRCEGEFIFQDGDNVVLYAEPTNQGFYNVAMLKNTTKNFIATNIAKSNPVVQALIMFFGAGFVSWIALAIISFVINLFIGVDGHSTAYAIWEKAVIIGAILIGVFGGKMAYQGARDNNKAYDEMTKELQKYKE